MISTDRQLTSWSPKGLLTESKPLRLQRLVHSLYNELRRVRKEKSSDALYKALQLSKEINSLGFAVIILQDGKITGAEDLRFKGKAITVEDEVAPKESQEARFLRIKKMFERLPVEKQRQLLSELQFEKQAKRQEQVATLLRKETVYDI